MSFTPTKDDLAFIIAMEEAVKERGAGWTYPSPKLDPAETEAVGFEQYLIDEWHADTDGVCVYQKEDGTPACIIGLALSKMGKADSLPPFDVIKGASGLLSEVGGFSPRLRRAADEAQGIQDQGRPWGDALAQFKEVVDA